MCFYFVGNWTVSTPFFVGGNLFVAMTNGQIMSVDTVGQTVAPLANMTDRIFADGGSDAQGYIYFADVGGNVNKYSRDGKLQWTSQLDGPVYGGLLVVNSTVAVPTLAGSFYLLDTATGDTLPKG